MDQTTSSLGNVTGGGTPTGNPQDIGSQNITAAPQNNLQSQTSNLLNGSSGLTLTGPTGQPVVLGTSTAATIQPASLKTQPNQTNKMAIIGVCGLIIMAVFAATWLTSRKSSLYDH